MPQNTSRWALTYWLFGDANSLHGATQALATTVDTALTQVNALALLAKQVADTVTAKVDRLEKSPVARGQVPDNGTLVAASGTVGAVQLPVAAWNDRLGMRNIGSFPTRVFAPGGWPGLYQARARVVWPSVPSVVSSDRRKALIVASTSGGTTTFRTPQDDVLVTDVAPVVQYLDSGVFFLEAGGSVELHIGHNRGGGLTTPGGPAGTYLELEYLGPLP